MSTRHPDSTLSDRIALNLAAERAKADARRHQTKRRRERRKRAKQREADTPALRDHGEGGGR